MWDPMQQDNLVNNHRGLSPIPEFDYYNADDEDEDSSSASEVSMSSTARLLAKLSNSDLAFEWSMLCQACTDCWSGNGKDSFANQLLHTESGMSHTLTVNPEDL